MAADWYSQLVAERRRREIDFSAELGAGESIQSFDVTVATVEGDGTAVVTGAAVSEGSAAVEFILGADLPGLYLVTAKAPTSSGQTLLAKTSIRVADGDGVVPGGYASAADLQAAYGSMEIERLGDAAGARVEWALKSASADVNGYLVRYQLPLGPGPWPLLSDATCAIARRLLYDDEVPKAVQESERSVRKRLWGVYFGSIPLRDASGTEAPRAESAAAQFVGADPVFTRSSLEGF